MSTPLYSAGSFMNSDRRFWQHTVAWPVHCAFWHWLVFRWVISVTPPQVVINTSSLSLIKRYNQWSTADKCFIPGFKDIIVKEFLFCQNCGIVALDIKIEECDIFVLHAPGTRWGWQEHELYSCRSIKDANCDHPVFIVLHLEQQTWWMVIILILHYVSVSAYWALQGGTMLTWAFWELTRETSAWE